MERRFTRFRRGPLPANSGAFELPDDGFCLSVFLVLESPRAPGSVLMGKLDPAAPWWEIGALDPKRLGNVGDRWMLPSCQLLLFESPIVAARRILKEQLDSGEIPLQGPQTFSDPATRPGSGTQDPHWDFHFVYRGRWPSETPPRARPWKRLEFVDVSRTARAEIARQQGDVLELVGLQPRE